MSGSSRSPFSWCKAEMPKALQQQDWWSKELQTVHQRGFESERRGGDSPTEAAHVIVPL